MDDFFWWRGDRPFFRLLRSWIQNLFRLDRFSLNVGFVNWRRWYFSFFFFFNLWFSWWFYFGLFLELFQLNWFDVSGGLDAGRLRTNFFIFLLFPFLFFLHYWKINDVSCVFGLSLQLISVVS